MSNFDEKVVDRIKRLEREVERLKVKESSGAWLDWTPTLSVSGGTAPTYNATFVNRFCMVGKLITVQMEWYSTTGGTAGSGSSAIVFTLPVPAANPDVVTGSGLIWENGGVNKGILGYIRSTTTANFVNSTSWSDIIADEQSSAERYISATFTYEAA